MPWIKPGWILFAALTLQAVTFGKLHEAAVLLRADWTRYEPEITRPLASASRSGVPTDVNYSREFSGHVQLLPDIVSRSKATKAIYQPGSELYS